MSSASRERVTVFHVGDEYLFATYFGRSDVFGELREYYDDEQYHFAVPDAEFDDVAETLRTYGYEPRVVEDVEPYCVVKERYEPHADILRESVAHWQRRGHNFFLMSDERAVEAALEQGATRVSETEFVVGL